jgi:hypothetical protein
VYERRSPALTISRASSLKYVRSTAGTASAMMSERPVRRLRAARFGR